MQRWDWHVEENLFNHQKCIQRTREEAALKSTNAFEKGIRYDQTSKRWKDIANAMTIYLAKDMLPINIVKSRVLNEF